MLKIVKQPDGLWAVWCQTHEAIIEDSLTPTELIEYFVNKERQSISDMVFSKIDKINKGEKPYPNPMTFERAIKIMEANGDDTGHLSAIKALPSAEEMAKAIIGKLHINNPAVLRQEPTYSEEIVSKFTEVVGAFFSANPRLWNEEDLLNITDFNEIKYNDISYSKLEYWKELGEVIFDYFNKRM